MFKCYAMKIFGEFRYSTMHLVEVNCYLHALAVFTNKVTHCSTLWRLGRLLSQSVVHDGSFQVST